MLASAPKHNAPKKQVPEACPTLEPIETPEADTGLVKLQEVKTVAAMIAEHKSFFIKDFFWLKDELKLS